MNKSAAETLSLTDLLAGVSGQMDSLASEVHQIEHAIGDELVVMSAQGAQTITRLQRLDFLRQSLEDLALLMHFLSKNHDGYVEPGIADKLRLDATKALLQERRSARTRFPPDDRILGEVDLF